MVEAAEDLTTTPNKDEDFFSSWDKPAIKRPTPPPSRTATPSIIGRTPSPLNSPAASAISRSKSPLSATSTPASRTTTSSALRTKAGTTGARKSGVLGAKKGAKLGAKKIGAGEAIDFDEAEKKAKEEAERISKLGYDPDAETDKKKETVKIVAPTPSATATRGHQRNSSDVERLGLQMNRLGFGQVAVSQPAKAAPKRMGFGSVAPTATGMLAFYH